MAMASHRQSGKGETGKHFAGAHAAQANQVPTPSRSVQTDPLDEAAPRPVDDSTASFERLSSTEGAVMGADAVREQEGDRDDDEQRPSRRFTVVLAIAVVVVIAAGFYLFANSCSSRQPSTQQDQQTVTEQTQTTVDNSIEYRGATYALATNDSGAYVLRETNSADGTQATVDLAQLDGTPVTLVLYNGAFIMPENKADGTWDVISYTIGSGAGPISSQSGDPYGGQGNISDASLDGSNLNLTIDGSQQTIPLEW